MITTRKAQRRFRCSYVALSKEKQEVPAEIRLLATRVFKETVHYSFLGGIPAMSWCDSKTPAAPEPWSEHAAALGRASRAGTGGDWQGQAVSEFLP